MKIPWMRLLDTAIGVADIARTASGGRGKPEPPPRDDLEIAGRMGPGGLEARLAGVVVAALKEAFDRDSRRLDLDRQQIAVERERAERALRLELQRQATDREIGRLRLLAGVAVTVWIGTLVLSARLIAGGLGARASLGVGWLFLLGAIAASFVAQSRAAAAVEMLATGDDSRGAIGSGAAGAFALWLLLCGLVLVGVAALLP
jgi:hypothetical protein